MVVPTTKPQEEIYMYPGCIITTHARRSDKNPHHNKDFESTWTPVKISVFCQNCAYSKLNKRHFLHLLNIHVNAHFKNFITENT